MLEANDAAHGRTGGLIVDQARAFARDEYWALRREIELRITIQNICLILVVLVFLVTSLAQIVVPSARYPVALVFGLVAGSFSLFWIHSGARTLQIKTYLRHRLEAQLGAHPGWETWHDVHRLQGLLGSRWFISTKGVLVGTQFASCALGWITAPPGGRDVIYAALSIAALLTTAILLRRPRLPAAAYKPLSRGP